MVRAVRLLSASLLGLWLAAGCSLLNAPDDVQPGGAGAEGGGGSASTSSQGGGGEGGGAECAVPADCAALETECLVPTCTFGRCETVPRPAGTPCGSAASTQCDRADACDGNGVCVDVVAVDGTPCSDCAAGPGSCSFCLSGACSDCAGGRATHKTFRHPLSTVGWTFTGDWGLYKSTPPSVNNFPPPTVDVDEVDFQRPVIGTDGNRARPYPTASEREESLATSPPTVLPATLRFRSWHVDEGFNYDKKVVRVSADGGASFTLLHVCPDPPAVSPYPFCEERRPPRAADDWDLIEMPIPANLVGQVGVVQFRYDSRDSCCEFEQGWYLDALEFATDCACANSAECGHLDGTCATGFCDDSFSECALSPRNLGSNCGAESMECRDAEACDDYGFCAFDDRVYDGDPCQSCDAGFGFCRNCAAGTCDSCPALQGFDAFFGQGWKFESKWTLGQCVQPNSLDPASLCANSSTAQPPPYLANRGSRQFSQGDSSPEDGTLTTPPVVLPTNLEFKSWHQDKGGKNDIFERDNKRIRLSLDGGATWSTVVDCAGSGVVASYAFCDATPSNVNRSLDDWDSISIPLGNLAGQVAIVEIRYTTVDSGQGWERGWMLDDLNFARCGSH